MATGDIVSVTIRADGWSADVVQEGDCTGGVYDFGLGANNADLASAKFLLTVTSEGYSASGVLGTIERLVVGTAIVRLPTPDDASLDQVFDDTNTTTRIALSDFVYDDDQDGGAGTSGVDVAVAISGGWCTVSGTPQSTFSGTATNSSTLDYPQAFGRWAWCPFEHVTADFLVEASVWHRSGIACVKFDAVDEHANSAAQQTATAMTKTTRTGDAKTVLVHAATIPVTGMTSGDVVTANFTAYPRVGDADSVLSSDLIANGGSGYAAPDERLGPLPVYYSTANVVYAVVDSAEANDTAGRASTTLATAEAGRFKTIGGAVNTATYGIKAVNGGTADAAVIYLVAGNHAFPGAALAGGNTKAWCRILPHPTLGAKATSIINAASNTAVSGYLKVEGLTASFANTGGFRGNVTTGALWLHGNVLNLTGDAPAYAWKCCYGTQNTVTAFKGGFLNYSTSRSPWALFRGNDGTGLDATISVTQYCLLANSGRFTCNFQATGNAASHEISDRSVVAWNECLNVATQWYGTGAATTITGLAVVGNIVEKTQITTPLGQIAADGSTAACDHVVMWGNTFVGPDLTAGRFNAGYLDSGTTNVSRANWSVKYNLGASMPYKTDTFPAANAARVLNWCIGYGVGHWGNIWQESLFPLDYSGGGTIYDGTPDFASNLAASTGGGDYAIGEDSDALSVIPAGGAVIPYDLDGNAIPDDGTGDAGALQDQLAEAPTVTTTAASSVGNDSAVLGGEVTDDGGDTVTERGIVWNTTGDPDITDNKVAIGTGTGAFSDTVGSLPAGTTIYFNAYATNSVGTSYGTADDFTTIAGDPYTTPAGTIAADGETLTLTWTRAGGWPVDMTGYATAECVVTVSGSGRTILATTGALADVDGETLSVERTLASVVYAGEMCTVEVEAGQAYSEADSETIRTEAVPAGTSLTNSSEVPIPVSPTALLVLDVL